MGADGREVRPGCRPCPGDWRRGVQASQVGEKLAADPGHQIKAVTIVQNETSTGCASQIPLIRAAMDGAGHPALLIVDTISSLGSVEYRHDEWGVDVTIWCSQKGMMLPPGLGLNAISEKALAAARHARLPRSYWDWPPMLAAAETGLFPYTPATNLLFGLREALAMFDEEGLPAVLARHARHAEATRRAVRGWGLDLVCQNPDDYSSTLTAVMLPDGLRRGPGASADPGPLQHVARRRARAAGRPGVPHRPSGRSR